MRRQRKRSVYLRMASSSATFLLMVSERQSGFSSNAKYSSTTFVVSSGTNLISTLRASYLLCSSSCLLSSKHSFSSCIVFSDIVRNSTCFLLGFRCSLISPLMICPIYEIAISSSSVSLIGGS